MYIQRILKFWFYLAERDVFELDTWGRRVDEVGPLALQRHLWYRI